MISNRKPKGKKLGNKWTKLCKCIVFKVEIEVIGKYDILRMCKIEDDRQSETKLECCVVIRDRKREPRVGDLRGELKKRQEMQVRK